MDVLKVLAVSFMLHPHCGPMKGQPVAMEDEAVRIVTSKGVTFLRCPDGRTIIQTGADQRDFAIALQLSMEISDENETRIDQLEEGL